MNTNFKDYPPGSDAARNKGCLCPPMDNGHGKGAYGGMIIEGNDGPSFWVNWDCPLHGEKGRTNE